MEKYDIKNRLFYDGYNLDNSLLESKEFMTNLMDEVNQKIFDNKGSILIIPYFNGKIKKDGGYSGIILGNNFHFTCHSFCYKNTVFIDYYGEENQKEKLLNIIFKYFDTKDYDLGSKDKKGNFGKHIIINTKPISLSEAKEMVASILKDISMTPINDLIVNENNDYAFDILQPIAESHISFHEYNDELIIDVFSCKYFSVEKLISLINNYDNMIEVNRGIKYQQ